MTNIVLTEQDTHRLNCPAFLAQNTRMCGVCYYINNIDHLSKCEVLWKCGIDLNNIEILGTHWNLKIKIIDKDQHKIHSQEERIEIIQDNDWILFECENCNEEFYDDNHNNEETESYQIEPDSYYCLECYLLIIKEIKNKIFESWLQNDIKKHQELLLINLINNPIKIELIKQKLLYLQDIEKWSLFLTLNLEYSGYYDDIKAWIKKTSYIEIMKTNEKVINKIINNKKCILK